MITNLSIAPGSEGVYSAGSESRVTSSGTRPVMPAKPQKEVPMSTMHCSLLSLGCIFGFTTPNQHAGLTALRALKIAQRRLRPEVRAKLLGLSSSRTDGSLTPDAWRFVFLDPATSGNCRVVTVAAKTSSEHPDTVEAFASMKNENVAGTHAVAQNKWTVDSDKALDSVRHSSKLKGVTSAEFRLVQPRSGQEAQWTILFFAEGPDAIARFQIGAKTGTVKTLNGNS